MARQLRPTEEYQDICDYCDEQISHEDMSQWAHIVRGYISKPTEKARFLRFLWIKDKRYIESAPGNKVVYDFHASCFDNLMQDHKSRTTNTTHNADSKSIYQQNAEDFRQTAL